MADEWSHKELVASVEAYRSMQRSEAEAKPYSKRKIYKELAEQFGRTEKAFEYRMQNISSVLDELGEPWLPGLKPAANVGTNVKQQILAALDQSKARLSRKLAVLADYKKKLPAIRDWLIEVARHQGKVTYGHVMEAFGLDRFSLRHAMDFLGHQAQNLDEPIITALIVNKGTQRCSVGITIEFGVQDDEMERQRLYDYWSSATVQNEATHDLSSDIEVRAARFVSVEARPDQAAFRRRVFMANNGTCVISGCNVGEALDAAHRKGRSWRLGHNFAEDGYLLRKDLHALYDSGLIRITEDGTVELNEAAEADLEHYRVFAGTKVTCGNCGPR